MDKIGFDTTKLGYRLRKEAEEKKLNFLTFGTLKISEETDEGQD